MARSQPSHRRGVKACTVGLTRKASCTGRINARASRSAIAPGWSACKFDLTCWLGAEQQEQEHAPIIIVESASRAAPWRGSLALRRLTRLRAQRNDLRRRARDVPGAVLCRTRREQGNEAESGDEAEAPGVDHTGFSLSPQTGWGESIVGYRTVYPTIKRRQGERSP